MGAASRRNQLMAVENQVEADRVEINLFSLPFVDFCQMGDLVSCAKQSDQVSSQNKRNVGSAVMGKMTA